MKNKNQLENIYNKYSTDIYKYALFKLQNTDDAQDVTAETFLRTAKKDLKIINKYWLISTARNIIYEHYRSRQIENTQEINGTELGFSEIKDNDLGIEEKLINAELLADIKKSLADLDELTKEVLLLKIWDDFKFAEIANLILENESTVKMRYYRGLRKLKEKLSVNPKLLNISVILVFFAYKALKDTNEYVVPNNLINLIKTKSMETQNPVISNLVAHASYLSTAKVIGIIMAIATPVVAIGGVVYISKSSHNTNSASQENVASLPINSVLVTTVTSAPVQQITTNTPSVQTEPAAVSVSTNPTVVLPLIKNGIAQLLTSKTLGGSFDIGGAGGNRTGLFKDNFINKNYQLNYSRYADNDKKGCAAIYNCAVEVQQNNIVYITINGGTTSSPNNSFDPEQSFVQRFLNSGPTGYVADFDWFNQSLIKGNYNLVITYTRSGNTLNYTLNYSSLKDNGKYTLTAAFTNGVLSGIKIPNTNVGYSNFTFTEYNRIYSINKP